MKSSSIKYKIICEKCNRKKCYTCNYDCNGKRLPNDLTDKLDNLLSERN